MIDLVYGFVLGAVIFYSSYLIVKGRKKFWTKCQHRKKSSR